MNSSRTRWPQKWPWNEINVGNRRVLGEGSFGIAARYYTTCNSDQSIVVKEVKQSRNMPLYEREEKCEEAISETTVQMQMAEKDRAVRVFDLTPKDCDRDTLRSNPKTYIMMARALGDGKFNEEKAADITLMLDIAKQLFVGLDDLHHFGYLHRDIKPGNLLFERSTFAKYWEDCAPGACRFTLSDFGLACKRKSSKWGGKTTCTEQSCGTPLFIPPEIAKSVIDGDRTVKHYGRGMDYWALGVTLFEMFFHRFPGSLGNQGSLNSLMYYIKRLGTHGSNDWWKDSGLDSQAKKDKNYKLFRDILSKLLIPDRFSRVEAVMDNMKDLLESITIQSVDIPKVCVDPCTKCDEFDECRADVLRWECVAPPVKPVFVYVVLVSDDSIYGTWNYESRGKKFSYTISHENGKMFFSEGPAKVELQLDNGNLLGKLNSGRIRIRLSETGGVALSKFKPKGSDGYAPIIKAHASHMTPIKFQLQSGVGQELRDLKVLVAKHFNIDVEKANFFYDGTKDPILDSETLFNGDHLYLSSSLRNAVLYGPQVGKQLAAAVADAKGVGEDTFPYLQAAEGIMTAWPTSRWRSVARALSSSDSTAQAELAASLRPHINDLQKFFYNRLTAWYKLLDDLEAPLEQRMEEERAQNLRETQARCKTVGFSYCAQEVRMEIDEPVDYVKVEYTPPGEERTKLKFHRDGRIVKTRGDDVDAKHPDTLTSPTLPGSIPLAITLCKDLLKSTNSKSVWQALGNLFVSSESRCEKIGEEKFSYTLYNSGAQEDSESGVGRKKFKFIVSSDPKVTFEVWEGNFILASR